MTKPHAENLLQSAIDMAERLVEFMEQLTDEQRTEVTWLFRKRYCEYCGSDLEKYGTCHCMNDE